MASRFDSEGYMMPVRNTRGQEPVAGGRLRGRGTSYLTTRSDPPAAHYTNAPLYEDVQDDQQQAQPDAVYDDVAGVVTVTVTPPVANPDQRTSRCVARCDRRTKIFSITVVTLVVMVVAFGGYELYKHLQETQGVTTHPEGDTTQPQGVTTHPERVTTQPQGVTTHPEGVTTQPQGVTTHPAGVTTQPQGVTTHPERMTTTAAITATAVTTTVTTTAATATTTTTTTATTATTATTTYTSSPRLVFGSKGSGIGQLDYPLGVDVDTHTGTIYVTDQYNHRLCLFTTSGHVITCHGQFVTPQGNSTFWYPKGVAVTPDGQLVMTDYNRVMVFVSGYNLSLVQVWGRRDVTGSGPGEFYYPFGVTVSGGLVYVADKYNNRIQILNPDDPQDIQVIGTQSEPSDIAVSPDTGHLYVVSWSYNTRIYNTRGQYLGDVTADGDNLPGYSITIDSSGQVYIGDVTGVSIITTSGVLIQRLGTGERGSCDGCFYYVYGLVVHPVSGDLIVADNYNHRIQIFSPNST